MNVGYFYAVRGAVKQEQRMGTISHNLANVNTTGFKQDKVRFSDFIINAVGTDFSQGPLRLTDRQLDVALQGEGFLKVQTPNGTGYTRDGSFHRDAQGNLLTGNGYQVMGTDGPISLGDTTGPVVIDSKGNISSGGEVLGKLALVDLADREELRAEGDNVYVWKGAGQPQEAEALDLEVIQGHLEQANVKLVREMAGMIESQRAFESYIKSIQSFAEIDSLASNQVGRLR